MVDYGTADATHSRSVPARLISPARIKSLEVSRSLLASLFPLKYFRSSNRRRGSRRSSAIKRKSGLIHSLRALLQHLQVLVAKFDGRVDDRTFTVIVPGDSLNNIRLSSKCFFKRVGKSLPIVVIDVPISCAFANFGVNVVESWEHAGDV